MEPLTRARFLAHARNRGFLARVERSRAIVREALGRCQNPYIGFSGGKDSTCTAALVLEQRPGTPLVYLDARCAFPEVSQFLSRLEARGETVIRWPCRPFLEILAEHGLHSDAVEQATMRHTVWEPVAALQQAHGYDAAFLGLRAEEAPGRQSLLDARGPTFLRQRDGMLLCCPVARWSFQDVWAFILSRGLDYCAAYDRLFAMDLPERAIRVSYWAGESGRRWGRYEALRRGWPDLWRQLCDTIPEAKSYG